MSYLTQINMKNKIILLNLIEKIQHSYIEE